ncbi:MAG: VCBS repeat-containing protein [Planctomycetota bacterium]|nr:MAG: VCBS repeat-containing protein [Planctomycetota bacterium]
MSFRSLAARFQFHRAARAAAVGLASAIASSALAAQAPWLPHPTVANCGGRALGDVDGDGRLDMVSTSIGEGATLYVHLGKGDGSFTAQPPYAAPPFGAFGAFVRCADLDLDGDDDVLLLEDLLFSNGQGGFASPSAIPWPIGAQDPYLTADIDADGATEILSDRHGVVTVLEYDPVAGFGAPVVSAGSTSTSARVLCDANNDGQLDLVVSSALQLGVRLGNGTGAFGAQQPLLAFFLAPTKLAAGDLDLDGLTDVCAYIGGGVDDLVVCQQQASGFAVAQVVHDSTDAESQLELVDVDVDGQLDALLHENSQYLHVFAGSAGGAFAPATPLFLGEPSTGFCVGDVDGDGRPDVVGKGNASTGAYARLFWRFGTAGGIGGTQLSAQLPSSGPNEIGRFAAAGERDVVAEVDNAGARELRWIRVDGSGFTPLATTPVATAVFGALLARVDHDGDGRDWLLRASSLQTLELFDVASPLAPVLSLPIGESIYDVEAADFDANGQQDFVVCGAVSGCLPVRFTPTGLVALPAVLTAPSGQLASSVALGQIDGLGAPDLVALHPSGLVTWCAGNGDGTFGAPHNVATVAQPKAVHVFDVDGDGRLDIHVTSAQSEGVLFSYRQPGGVFAAVPLVIGCGTRFGLADIDLDGRLDLVTRGGGQSIVVVRRGTNSPSGFAPIPQEVNFGAGAFAMSNVLVAEDLDGDGRADLLLSNSVRFGLMRHRDYATPGTQSIGTGTSGCAGAHAWEALSQPLVGNAAFALRGDAAPANGFGLALISAQADAQGSDPFQLGPLFHVGLAGVFVTGVHADASGVATKHVPVPNDPALAATQLTTQVVWAWTSGPCLPTQPLGLSSSPGLTLNFLP